MPATKRKRDTLEIRLLKLKLVCPLAFHNLVGHPFSGMPDDAGTHVEFFAMDSAILKFCGYRPSHQAYRACQRAARKIAGGDKLLWQNCADGVLESSITITEQVRSFL
jgi:hypothetical protein